MKKFRAIAAAVLAVAPIVAVATPADAAAPATAQTWSTLMYRSLNPSELVKWRTMLPALRRTVVTSSATATQAARTQAAARTAVTAAAGANRVAKNRHAIATTKLTAARKADAKRKARAALKQRTTELTASAVALRTAQTRYRNATAKLSAASSAWRAATVAVRNAEQKVARAEYDAAAAGQARKISAQVVTDTRSRFTNDDATQVYGITVNKTIAYAFQHMIDDAARAGIPLSGGGFRTKQRQIELRTINGCPDIWTAPSSSCRVPTAIPGRSLHEIGLAVDMTSGGKSVARDTVAFKWLAAHAASYGFVNLPSEPWHWSITGN
ncbi:M15 family metallopeptidase [Paractinoplanes rhizophilus]|uniref:M15 family metallopeptidase n=1 Tax=Paractinoplanes rhizophilus TaxID=1416877 RepID=A0ABW2HV82_9ACTN|nr:M15 family metallopeptidase [Actinoplanes sp.]